MMSFAVRCRVPRCLPRYYPSPSSLSPPFGQPKSLIQMISHRASAFSTSSSSPSSSPSSSSSSSPSSFPSLTITSDELLPHGSFSEAQAEFLSPDPQTVEELDELLAAKKVGIVAHFYMDPELQGVLSALQWPHIFVADSLAMGDEALKMAASGVKSICVLGVDFMSENVQATLQKHGYDIPVYRLSEKAIGCSLAEAAESLSYLAYLKKAAQQSKHALHVVYINTSLVTKAQAHTILPTITCTSSNVLQTILQATAQVPELDVYFGPDTYMGENLYQLLQHMATEMTDEEIGHVHPAHTRASITAVLKRFSYFLQGNCIVHHMFGGDVTRRVQKEHASAYQTAHFEVPGEMFLVALAAQQEGRGVVGSTSDILGFILSKTKDALLASSPSSSSLTPSSSSPPAATATATASASATASATATATSTATATATATADRLQFVLGTEAGMITPIVMQVQSLLKEATLTASSSSAIPSVEIIFPVSSEAVSADTESGLGVVPGVSGGEGCSTAGGCATCPYMKMNNIDSLMDVLTMMNDSDASSSMSSASTAVSPASLLGFRTKKYTQMINGVSAAELGVLPITHMREYQASGFIGQTLLEDIFSRGQNVQAQSLHRQP